MQIARVITHQVLCINATTWIVVLKNIKAAPDLTLSFALQTNEKMFRVICFQRSFTQTVCSVLLQSPRLPDRVVGIHTLCVAAIRL